MTEPDTSGNAFVRQHDVPLDGSPNNDGKAVDLSGISPLRRTETLRRMSVLDRYLTLDTPTAKQTADHAADIGIGVAQFYRLAKAWRIHHDPELLGAGRRGSRRRRRDGISDMVKKIVADAIDELGADASHAAIGRDVARRCELEGATPPSQGALWTYVMDARATSARKRDDPRRILIARFWAKLPTITMSGTTFPEVVVAMLLPDRLILGTDVSFAPNRKADAALALARAFTMIPASDHDLEVLADAGDVRDITAVHLARLGTEPSASPTSTSAILSANLGRVFGGLGIVQRRQRTNLNRLLRTRSTRAIDVDTAAGEITRAVAAHNAAVAAHGQES